jgi:hypothetical protein
MLERMAADTNRTCGRSGPIIYKIPIPAPCEDGDETGPIQAARLLIRAAAPVSARK